MKTLLVEIGTEEIPAGYIEPALTAFAESLSKRLTQARIAHDPPQTMGTPRRLTLMAGGVAEEQETVTTTITGPPESVGLDENGRFTTAAVKFAEKSGVLPESLVVRDTDKGRYLSAVVTETGRPTRDILREILPDAILSMPFPKTMKWGDLHIHFARPIYNLLILLGNEPIEITIGNVTGTNTTYGHRFMKPEPVTIPEPSIYVDALRAADVIVDPAERKAIIETEVDKAARDLGGKVFPDPELVDTVTNLVEYPAVVAGRFDDDFLELPDAVLITAMREHQKYFAVVDDTGRLLPGFITVNNTRARDMALVARGNERVLRARLADARFFFRADRETDVSVRREKLKGLLFHAKLGTMFDKSARLESLAAFLAGEIGADETVKLNVVRAAQICKTDLVSQVVVEFPKLQGIMGRVYAEQAGEPLNVAAAVEEHYRPVHSGGLLPETGAGALLAIADKIDSICGCFHIGLTPTGAADPYALRRQAIGILQILRDRRYDISLRRLVETANRLFAESDRVPHENPDAVDMVIIFFQNRLSHLLTEEGFSKDVVAAVLEASADRIPEVRRRATALEDLKKKPDFEPLAAGFKRVVNILRKEGRDRMEASPDDVDPSLFSHDAEQALFDAYRSVRETIRMNTAGGQFDEALRAIAGLRKPVDDFFDGVLVMAEDDRVKQNRFALLRCIAGLFERIADFSKLSA